MLLNGPEVQALEQLYMDSWSCPDDENISSHFALSWSCRVVANAKLPYRYWYRHVFIGVSPETSLAASLTTIKRMVQTSLL